MKEIPKATKFKCTKYIDGKLKEVEAVTLPRSDFNVGVNVVSWRGLTLCASHFYASLNISSLNCKIVGDDSGETFSGNEQPEETQSKRIDVFGIALKNIYGECSEKNSIEVRKGYPTTRFGSIEECIVAIESTFENEFDNKWKLVDESTDTAWDQYKKELIKDYALCNTT